MISRERRRIQIFYDRFQDVRVNVKQLEMVRWSNRKKIVSRNVKISVARHMSNVPLISFQEYKSQYFGYRTQQYRVAAKEAMHTSCYVEKLMFLVDYYWSHDSAFVSPQMKEC